VTTTVYTDGACLGNPGPGGWAWFVPGERYASGPEALTTNQRMEIRAALEALRAIDGPVEVVSDSTYVVNCFRDRWWEGWLARGWLNKARKPVANRDLWEPLIDLVRADPSRVQFRWVKGHADDPANDVVDRLAVDAARTQSPRVGTGTPTDLGPADIPANEVDPRVPAGRLVVVAGHRPPELGGYVANPVADDVRRQITEILVAKRELHADLVVLTGLGLGAEQLGAEAALEAGVPFVAVLPYPDQESVWPEAGKDRYRDLLANAQSTVLLQARAPDTRQKAGAALARRDAWLVRHAHEAVVVWDGSDDRIGRLIRSLEERLPDDVWVITPVGRGG
jgi:ribonuclease HI